MRKEHDRVVTLQGMDKGTAEKAVKNLGEAFSASSVKRAVLQFKTVDMYSFRAEYTVKGNDLIIHFYLPKHANLDTPKARQGWMDYWLKTFAAKLDTIAQEFFDAKAPQLQAKYTDEVASWWFRAQGFGLSSDPTLLTQRFLEKLDASLKTRS